MQTASPVEGKGEVILRLGGCPTETTPKDLGRQFSKYGNITTINVKQDGRGPMWYVAFLPTNPGPFWERLERGPILKRIRVGNIPTEFHINIQRFVPYPRTIDNRMPGMTTKGRNALSPTLLEFGILTGEQEMTVMRSLPNTGDGSLMLDFNFGAKRMDMKFSYVVPDPDNTQTANGNMGVVSQFKGDITFTNITKIHVMSEPGGSQSLVIITATPSLFFRKRRNVEPSYTSPDSWNEHEAFQRITDIVYDQNMLQSTGTALVKTDPDIDLGRWLVYRLVLPDSDESSWSFIHEGLQH